MRLARSRSLLLCVASVSCIGVYSQTTHSAPFGIEMGTRLQSLDIKTQKPNSIYDLASVPEPSELFNSYSVRATPEAGVCNIYAWKVYGDKDDASSAFRLAFRQISSVYGSTSILDEKSLDDSQEIQNHWRNQRGEEATTNNKEWAASWPEFNIRDLLKSDRQPLPNDVASISLDVTDTSSWLTSYRTLNVSIAFANSENCLPTTQPENNPFE